MGPPSSTTTASTRAAGTAAGATTAAAAQPSSFDPFDFISVPLESLKGFFTEDQIKAIDAAREADDAANAADASAYRGGSGAASRFAQPGGGEYVGGSLGPVTTPKRRHGYREGIDQTPRGTPMSSVHRNRFSRSKRLARAEGYMLDHEEWNRLGRGTAQETLEALRREQRERQHGDVGYRTPRRDSARRHAPSPAASTLTGTNFSAVSSASQISHNRCMLGMDAIKSALLTATEDHHYAPDSDPDPNPNYGKESDKGQSPSAIEGSEENQGGSGDDFGNDDDFDNYDSASPSATSNEKDLVDQPDKDPGIDPSDDWPTVWEKLKSIGWKSHYGRGLETEWCYYPPRRGIKGCIEGVNYLVGEQDVRDYCERNYGWDPEGSANEHEETEDLQVAARARTSKAQVKKKAALTSGGKSQHPAVNAKRKRKARGEGDDGAEATKVAKTMLRKSPRLHIETSASETSASETSLACTVEDFEECLDIVAEEIGGGIDEIEERIEIRSANTILKAGDVNPGCGKSQHKAQYGRMKPKAVHFLLNHLLKDGENIDLLVDIGSGIGSLVFQAAVCFGIKSRGIELVVGRHKMAEKLQLGIVENTESAFTPDGDLVQLYCGDFTHALRGEHIPGRTSYLKSFLLGRDVEEELGHSPNLVLFANNAQSIFSEFAGNPDCRCLDDYLATLFSMAPDGARLVTFSQIDRHFGGATGKTGSESWFATEEFTTEKDAVTWSSDPQKLYIYTKNKSKWRCASCNKEKPVVQMRSPTRSCSECVARKSARKTKPQG